MSALYSCLKGKNDAIMAANSSDGTRTVEPEETHEECSGKKKSKFQAFKKLFVKKKRKEPTTPIRESNLKPCQSSSDISASTANTTAFQVNHEAVAKGNMGNKAVSHDSVFVSEMESSVKEDISQECTPGKVKALQLQLQQNIRIGSLPQGIVPKKLEDSGALSEDDGLPKSPPEITSLHEILAHSSGKSFASAQRRSSISLGGTDSEDEPESSELSSRPTSPLPSIVLSCPTSPVSHFPQADFTSPPSSVTCLDNSAAKHRILIKPKKRRAPTMNVKPKQTIDETDKPVPEEKEEENYDMIEEQQSVKIPGSEKELKEQEAPSEEVKHLAVVVPQKPKENLNVSVCEEESPSKNTNISFPLEASLLENQQVSFQNEAVCSESDVDFHESQLCTGDQMDITEDDSERDDDNALLQTCDFSPMSENITVMVKPAETNDESPESNTSPIENPNLITSQGLVCGALETNQLHQEEAEAPTVGEMKDEECNGHDNVCSDIPSDLLNVMESELVAGETLQNCILSVEPCTAMIKDEDIQEVWVSPECVGSYESGKEDHLGTTDIIQSTAIILDMSDQLIANDEVKDEHSSSEQNTVTSDWSITESNDERPDTDNVTDSKAYAVITNAKDYSFTKISTTTTTYDFGIRANSKTSTETVKEMKPAEPTSNSNVKGPNKPVRFTVAPAWQRALSSGSNIKDSPFIKNVEGNIRSESSDGSDESVVHSNSSKENVIHKNKEESCGHFGVKLRRTSSSIKYSEDHQEEVSRQGLSPVDTSSLSPGRNLPTPKRQHVNTDCAKMSKISSAEEKSTPESRNQPKPRAEDHIPQENSEPAWITMAKLKQKGFQEHPLAREQSSITEHEKIEEAECIQKKNIVTNPQEEEKRCEQAAAGSPAESEVAQPVSEMSTHSTQPPNPDEPPWFTLAKKKAKAWSEMPQIVQQ